MTDAFAFESLGLVPILIAFGFGALSFVSPCVLPLLPGYLSLMSGYSVSDLQEGKASSGRMARVTLLFILGFTVVFMAWGASASALGGFLRRNQATTSAIAGWIVVVFGLVVLISALFNAPWLQNLVRERKFDIRPSRLGPWAPPVMGVAFGFAWTPCIGPVLGSILTLASQTETVGSGMILLFAYSMGLGIPFLAAAVGMTKAFGAIGVLRRHLRTINVVSGVALVAFGILMIQNRVFELSIIVSDWLQKLGLEWLSAI